MRGGQIVYINDTSLLGMLREEAPRAFDSSQVDLHFYTDEVEIGMDLLTDDEDAADLFATGFTSLFGGSAHSDTLRFNEGDVVISRSPTNDLGCKPYTESHEGRVLVVQRGDCTFLQKLVNAKAAGAVGVFVISDEDSGINPTSEKQELDESGEIQDVVMVLLPNYVGEALESMLDIMELRDSGVVRFSVGLEEIEDTAIPDEAAEAAEEPPYKERILYLNGIALTNTRLLV